MRGLGERKAENGLETALRLLVQASGDASAWRNGHADPAAYDGVFERMTQRIDETRKRLATERNEASARWQALESHPQTRRLVRVRNDRRFQTWGFHQFLVTRSHKLVEHDPKKALEAADLALAVAKSLNPFDYGEERTSDLLAIAWAAIAEARCHLGDADSAWDALECAEEALEEGTGDPLEKAELEQLKAQLFKAAGRDEDADRASRRAANMYRKIGDQRILKEPTDRNRSYRSPREVRGRVAQG